MFRECRDEAEWKKARTKYLTASDAANYCGINPFDNQGQLKLWEEKTGLKARPDISNKASVRYGKMAEENLRQLFILTYGWELYRYDQYGLWISDKYPFMAATLDGMIRNMNGEIWGLEIKTTTVHNGEQLRAWRSGEIPVNYWVQELHQMVCVPVLKGIVTFAHVRTEWNPEESYLLSIWHKREEQDVQDDMPWVISKAIEMNDMIQQRRSPAVKVTL